MLLRIAAGWPARQSTGVESGFWALVVATTLPQVAAFCCYASVCDSDAQSGIVNPVVELTSADLPALFNPSFSATAACLTSLFDLLPAPRAVPRPGLESVCDTVAAAQRTAGKLHASWDQITLSLSPASELEDWLPELDPKMKAGLCVLMSRSRPVTV